ncbi:hypothetical protein JST97_03010 [bacterium]|nr:hypothetical protein [bacterium]
MNFDEILPALERLQQRLPGRGQIGSQRVGQHNQLNGKVFYIEYESYRVVLAVSGLDRPKPSCSRAILPRRQEEIEFKATTGLDQRMQLSWDDLLYGLEDELQNFVKAPTPNPYRLTWAKDHQPVKPLPAAHYAPLSAALRHRVQAWNPSVLHLNFRVQSPAWACYNWPVWREWFPRLDAGIEEAGFQGRYQLEPARLDLPWPSRMDGMAMDALEFYRVYPDAHGRISVGPVSFSADGRQCALMLRHSLAIRSADFRRPPRLPDSFTSLPSDFTELLLLEKQGREWILSVHLPDDVDSPPALLEANEKTRLQRELGDWGKVLSVQVGWRTAIEAHILTPAGPRRVVCGPALARDLLDFEQLVFAEPTIWVFADTLTGASIREALQGSPG